MNKEEKAKLWADRIQQYQSSGQTCKQWCAENGIPLSTMGYWTRRLAKEDPASEPEQDLVFARLPSEQEVARKLFSEETAPVRIADAILYTLNQEVYLRRYLEDGHLSIDNNSAERALKNFAVGRRNWLFAKSIRGADASALVYSITETALLNHLKPYAYLTYILDELRKMGAFPKEEELKKLLPWSEDLPEYCRTKLKKVSVLFSGVSYDCPNGHF